MNITKITNGYKNLSFVLTERFTNAVDTYNLMLKLNTEQETSGEYDLLLHKLYENVKPYDLFIDVHPDFFVGREDVIFELSVNITMNTDCKLDNKDLVKEHILGSVLKDIQEHFDFYYRYRSDSDIDVVKHYFRNY
jgi:hypothetical protein